MYVYIYIYSRQVYYVGADRYTRQVYHVGHSRIRHSRMCYGMLCRIRQDRYTMQDHIGLSARPQVPEQTAWVGMCTGHVCIYLYTYVYIYIYTHTQHTYTYCTCESTYVQVSKQFVLTVAVVTVRWPDVVPHSYISTLPRIIHLLPFIYIYIYIYMDRLPRRQAAEHQAESQTKAPASSRLSLSLYIYIYIYICMYVCIYIYIYIYICMQTPAEVPTKVDEIARRDARRPGALVDVESLSLLLLLSIGNHLTRLTPLEMMFRMLVLPAIHVVLLQSHHRHRDIFQGE